MRNASPSPIRRWLTLALLASLVLGAAGFAPGRPAGRAGASSQKGGALDADQPDKAIEWRLMRMRDEHGQIPPGALGTALAQARRLQAAQASLPQVGGLARQQWTWLGPGNIGGRVRSLLVSPSSPSTLLAGSVGGGVWRSTDAGASWQATDDFMANLAVTTLALDPANPLTVYAGTGEGFGNTDAIRGNGIFKSTDGGLSWSQLAATNTPDFYWVTRLAVSSSGSTLLAATQSGFQRSPDSGATWSLVNSTDPYSTGVTDVAFDPADSSQAVASGYYGKVWYSTNGGLNWTPATGLTTTVGVWGRVEVAYAPSNPSIVYASVDHNNGEVWKSTDGGHSYAKVYTGSDNYLTNQGWYSNALWVDPTNPANLVVGGIDLWRSTDGGVSLTHISDWSAAPYASAHADHHAIASAPGFGSTNHTVYFGNDGGVYRTNNVYTVSLYSGWQALNNNLGITQFYGAAGNPTSGVIVGGTQDNGSLRFPDGAHATNSWTTMEGGDGGFAAANPTDPNVFYGEYIYLQIYQSTDAGLSANYIDGGLSDADNCALFIAPFILDPNNPDTLLAGGCSLWRGTNLSSSPTWTSIKPPTGGGDVSAVAVAPGNSDVIWVGYDNGEIDKTTNGTAVTPTWHEQDQNTPHLPQRYVTRLTIDPTNSNVVYATYGGYTAHNVWRTVDGGQNWTDITGSGLSQLPAAPVYSLVINPHHSDWLYVGTEIGVFASTDGGQHWGVPQDGPANVSVDELFWMNSNLVAATHGRGLWEIPIAPDLSISNTVQPAVASPGQTITYTLTYGNQGVDVAAGVVITDPLPAALTDLHAISSGATLTPTGGLPYTWNVADLPIGAGGMITITGVISPALHSLPTVLTATATIAGSVPDVTPLDNTSSASVAVRPKLYLPIVQRP